MKHYKKDQCYYKVIGNLSIIVYDFESLPTISSATLSPHILAKSVEIDAIEFDDAFFRVTNNLKSICYEN